MEKILVALLIIAVIAVALKLFKVSIKWVLRFVINAAIGIAALYLLNFIPGVNVPLNWITTVATGIFGIPAVIVILIISFLL